MFYGRDEERQACEFFFFYHIYIFSIFRWPNMSNPSERINYVQDSSSDTETDYKETEGRGRHWLYKNRLR